VPSYIRRLKEEFAPRSASQSNPDPDPNPNLWVPRARVQGILDAATSDPTLKSAVDSLLQSSGQFILKSTIQSLLNSTPELTTQPAPESPTQPASKSTIIIPDTRPIWPGRPELIYR
jgi:hypothetical protein